MRIASLLALAKLGAPQLDDALKVALASPDKALAAEARKLAGNSSPERAVEMAAKAFQNGSVAEQQAALAALAKAKTDKADVLILAQLNLLTAGKLAAAVQLDLLEAVTTRLATVSTGGDARATFAARLAAFEQTRKADDPRARWRECIEGGDAKAGRVIFAEKNEAGCQRCHAVAKNGGDVGPDLAGIAAKHDRAFLLRSIVEPNADIAPGYENVLVTLKSGDVLAGLTTKEDADTLTLKNVADGKLQPVKKADIKERTKLPSAMIPGLGEILTKRELRDLIEYLATLK